MDLLNPNYTTVAAGRNGGESRRMIVLSLLSFFLVLFRPRLTSITSIGPPFAVQWVV